LVDPAVSPDRFQTTREAITWFAAEHQVLIAATAVAESEGLDSYAWQIPCTMTEYFRATARIRDWERQNHVAFAAADRLGDPDAMGRVVFSIGTYARITGAFEDAVSQLNQSMSYFLENQDAAAQAAVHMGLSTAYISERPTLSPALVLENADAALKHANRALEIYRGSGNKTGQQFALIDLAEHHLALGQLLTAEECCTEAMELSIEVGDKSWGGDAFATMGRISYGLGRYEAAITHYLQALSTVGDFQIPIRPPSILEDLGDAYLKVGNVDAARAAWREVVEFNQKQEQARERPYWRAERARAKLEELPADQPAQATASDSAG
jgi:tetratricopeptide (TPR) repeat protein